MRGCRGTLATPTPHGYDSCGFLPSTSRSAVATARVAEPSGSLQDVKEWGLDREDLLQIYRNMLITRGVEERGHILYRQGKNPGSFYTRRGNEGAPGGGAPAVGPADGR